MANRRVKLGRVSMKTSVVAEKITTTASICASSPSTCQNCVLFLCKRLLQWQFRNRVSLKHTRMPCQDADGSDRRVRQTPICQPSEDEHDYCILDIGTWDQRTYRRYLSISSSSRQVPIFRLSMHEIEGPFDAFSIPNVD